MKPRQQRAMLIRESAEQTPHLTHWETSQYGLVRGERLIRRFRGDALVQENSHLCQRGDRIPRKDVLDSTYDCDRWEDDGKEAKEDICRAHLCCFVGRSEFLVIRQLG